ncbi:MAG TPA: hypothetical protein VF648_15260 [Pyrinomonadaceae bacterium]|jgi:hypothetical protein
MNHKHKILLILGAFALITLGIAVFSTIFAGEQEIAHAVAIDDWSESTPGDCFKTVELGRKAINSPQMEQGSTVTFLLTGDAATANEPRSLGTFPIPVSAKVLEGEQTSAKEQEKILSTIKAKCEQALPAQTSSIFLAVKSGAELLRNKGCKPNSAKCQMFVKSDLQENVEPQIKAALNGNAQALKKLPAPIDNRGIHLTVCGIAETKGTVTENKKERKLTPNRTAQQSDLIRQIWSGLFLEPQSVSFNPFCSN